jgi:hypothetical protein
MNHHYSRPRRGSIRIAEKVGVIDPPPLKILDRSGKAGTGGAGGGWGAINIMNK